MIVGDEGGCGGVALGPEAEPRHRPVERGAAGGEHGVVGVEQQSPADDGAGDDKLGVGQSGDIVDAEVAEMIVGEVGDQRRIGARHRQATAHQPAPRDLEHGDLGAAVAQRRASAAGPREVAALKDVVADSHPVAGA